MELLELLKYVYIYIYLHRRYLDETMITTMKLNFEEWKNCKD